MEAIKFNIRQEDKKQGKQSKKVCKTLIDSDNLLSEAITARQATKSKKVRPRKLSLNKVRNKARVIDIQGAMDITLDSKGKHQTISIEDFVKAQNKKKVPIMVRRCIARVQPKMVRDGQDFDSSFASAVQICTWVFQRHGFLRKNSRTYNLNKKGKDRNKFHRHRKDSSRFEQQFSRLYNRVFNPNKASKDNIKVVELGKALKANDKWAS